MHSRVLSVGFMGIETRIVEVEVDISRGRNQINIVGLPDKAVTEAKERIIPAIKNTLEKFPNGKITVNLAPANIPKLGSIYDLPIAIGILIAWQRLAIDTSDKLFLGELSLDGSLRPINGSLPATYGAKNQNVKEIYLPSPNQDEAGIVPDIDIYGMDTLEDLVSHFQGKVREKYIRSLHTINEPYSKYRFENVVGQIQAKRALEIAAAGGHNCLLSGVPGSGKTYLSKSLPSILPQMTFDEKIEVTKIYSICGLTDMNQPIIQQRPFRSPHHTSSQVALVGGGSNPKPGEVTLAHKGVLFLDEFNEFSAKTLEVLRQPLEDKEVSISRASGTIKFPAEFILLGAMNPCKCGFLGDPDRECTCSGHEIAIYQRKISGPIKDRIDLNVEIPRVKVEKLINKKWTVETSSMIRQRVERARMIQNERNDGKVNAEMTHEEIKKHITLNKESLDLLKTAVSNLKMTARSYFKVLKTARTIADLEQSESVKKIHISESLSFRLKN